MKATSPHVLTRILAAILILGTFLGCHFFLAQEEAVSLRLPSFPRSWLGNRVADGFEIVYTREGKEERYATLTGNGLVELFLPLGKRTPVVLYPHVTGEGGRITFCPAGGLYPDFFDSGALDIRWEDGFAAETLLLAARAGFPLDGFNCARFFEEARKRGGSNPWELNRAKVLQSLASGSFRADRFVVKKKYSLTLILPAGEWYGENLLEPPFTVGEGGTFLFQSLPWGVHRYWSKEHALTVRLSETGLSEVALYSLPNQVYVAAK